MRARAGTLAGVAALLVLTTACGGGGQGGRPSAAAGQPCDGLLKPADPAAALPPAIPSGVGGATFYQVDSQGATKRYHAHVPGDDLVKTRDTIKAAFEAAGFEIESSDEEAGAEAEFGWSNATNEGSVQVRPLCEGNLQVRWRVGPR